MNSDTLTKYLWPVIIVVSITIFTLYLSNLSTNVFDYSICEDGTISYSEGKGACSWHGGIEKKVYHAIPKDIKFADIVVATIMAGICGPLMGTAIMILIGLIIKKR